MYASITTVEVRIDRLAVFVRTMEAQILPRVRQLHGFHAAHLGVDRLAGQLVVIAYWETEADSRAAAANPVLQQFQAIVASIAAGAYARQTYELLLSS